MFFLRNFLTQTKKNSIFFCVSYGLCPGVCAKQQADITQRLDSVGPLLLYLPVKTTILY
jgi:hypothetical protein